MNISHINKLYAPWIGGVETHVQDVCEGLARTTDWRLNVLCCSPTWKSESYVHNGVHIQKVPSLGLYWSMPVSPGFPVALRNVKSDILHFHFPNPLADLSYLLTRPKGKVVVTWHSDIIKQQFFLRFYKKPLAQFLSQTDKILVTSPVMAQNSPFLRNFQDKTEVVPLSVDPEVYALTESLEKRVKTIQKTHGRFVLFVGRLVYYKGAQVLLEALQGTDIKVLMIGEGPLKSDLEARMSQTLDTGQVTILPSQPFDQLLAYFHACDFFVLPSIFSSEAFGIVQLEAMACKKAVVSTTLLTGVPWVNQHQQTGLSVPPNNADALREALTCLWSNTQFRSTYGNAGYDRVCTIFSQKKMISTIKALYETIV